MAQTSQEEIIDSLVQSPKTLRELAVDLFGKKQNRFIYVCRDCKTEKAISDEDRKRIFKNQKANAKSRVKINHKDSTGKRCRYRMDYNEKKLLKTKPSDIENKEANLAGNYLPKIKFLLKTDGKKYSVSYQKILLAMIKEINTQLSGDKPLLVLSDLDIIRTIPLIRYCLGIAAASAKSRHTHYQFDSSRLIIDMIIAFSQLKTNISDQIKLDKSFYHKCQRYYERYYIRNYQIDLSFIQSNAYSRLNKSL